ncbi:hypothetical protein SAZ11_46190 [Streptomyces sp. FXJ1.4098]|nr:hypothetical protein [Streptomyces sp. FXJ1.4098]
MCNNSTAGFTIVDDVPSSVPTYTDGCGKTGWTNSGTLSFRFNADAQNHCRAKGDLHQIGGGFGDHFWYAHARDDAHGASASLYDPEQDPGPASGVMAVTGTWKLNTQRTSWTRVLVHLPNTGSGSQQAVYTIHLGDGTTHTRIINAISHKNQWVSLGIYHFTAGSDFQGVSQSNYTPEGQADNDIAWDAVGFQWLSAKPQHIVAALGDSYSSGEGANDYDESSNQKHGTIDWNACRRSANAWPRKLVLPGMSERLSLLSDNHSPNAELGFVACSGARTRQVDGSVPASYPEGGDIGVGDGEFREIPQVDSGVLTKDTTLVTLTIGGNNYGAFVNAVTDCAYPTDCADDDFIHKYEALIDKTKEDMVYTLKAIAERAPPRRDPFGGIPGNPQPDGQVHRIRVDRRRRSRRAGHPGQLHERRAGDQGGRTARRGTPRVVRQPRRRLRRPRRMRQRRVDQQDRARSQRGRRLPRRRPARCPASPSPASARRA